MERPLLLIDVDGVISLFGYNHAAPPAGRYQLVDGITHFLSATAGEHLRRLGQAFDLAWCTGWEEKANDYLPFALGLDGPLPHVVFDPTDRPTQAHWKLGGIDRHVEPSRALAWLDDAHDDGCRSWAAARPGPTLLVTTDPAVGITEDEVDRLLAWASEGAGGQALAVTENTGGRRVATLNQLAPASPVPNTSPEVAPK